LPYLLKKTSKFTKKLFGTNFARVRRHLMKIEEKICFEKKIFWTAVHRPKEFRWKFGGKLSRGPILHVYEGV